MDEVTTHRRIALVRKAERWLSLLKKNYILCTISRPDSADAFVTVELNVNVATTLELDRGMAASDHGSVDGRLRKVREGIDLFYMMLALDADILLSRCGSETHDERAKQLVRAGAFQLHVTLTATDLRDTVLLERRLCQYFMEDLGRDGSSNAYFLRVRKEFEDELIETNPTWRHGLAQFPVVLRCWLGTPSQGFKDDCTMETHWHDILGFLLRAAAYRSTVVSSEIDTEGHIPLKWDQVRMWIKHVLFTDRVVEATKRLETIRKGFVACDRVYVDPLTMRSSCNAVTDVLNALSAGHEAKRLVVYIEERGVDELECAVDRIELYDAVLESVAKCDNLKRVDLSGMMDDQPPTTRRAIYRAMIRQLLSRPLPCGVSFESATLDPRDTDALRDEHAQWKEINPGARLRVTKLLVDIADGGNTFTSTLLNILDDAEKLDIANDDESAELLPATTIPTVLAKFASLRKLQISQVEVPSMDLFLEPLRLEELRMCDFRLADGGSFTRFVRALGDPATHVGRTLQVLDIQDIERDDVFQITPHETDQVCEALKTNRTLRRLELSVCAPVAERESISTRLKETVGRAVPAKSSSRRSNVERKRRLAFLSVVRSTDVASACQDLDAAIVRQVLAFAAPTTERTVSICMSAIDVLSDEVDEDLH